MSVQDTKIGYPEPPNFPAYCVFPPVKHTMASTLAQPQIHEITSYLQSEFDSLIARDALLKFYIKKLYDSGSEAVVFGGWVRDRVIEFLHGVACTPRDIDMVSHGPISVLNVLVPPGKINVFGGVGVKMSTINFDAWDLKNTYLIKKNALPVSFNTLPITADYTFNAILFRPKQFFSYPKILDNGAINAVLQKEIEFKANEVILPTIQVSRSLIFAAKLGFSLSATVREFIQRICEDPQRFIEVKKNLDIYCPVNYKSSVNNKLIQLVHS